MNDASSVTAAVISGTASPPVLLVMLLLLLILLLLAMLEDKVESTSRHAICRRALNPTDSETLFSLIPRRHRSTQLAVALNRAAN